MSTPGPNGRDLRLDRLDRPPDPLGDAAHVAPALTTSRTDRQAYEALIDAVFTAPGAAEWLVALRLRIAAFLADDEPRRPPTDGAIQAMKK